MMADGEKSGTSPAATTQSTLSANAISGNGYGNHQLSDNVVLLNTFVIWKKRYRVYYHSEVLVWEKSESKGGECALFVAVVE